MTGRHRRPSKTAVLSRSATKRGGFVIATAVVASAVAAGTASANPASGPGSSTSAQGSVRSSTKATPGNVGGTNDNGPRSGNKTTPQTRVPTGDRACDCGTPDPDSHVSAQQTTARHDSDGQAKTVSSHGPARSGITRIVARNNDDGTRTVSDQHGSSTFKPPAPEPEPKSAPQPAPADAPAAARPAPPAAPEPAPPAEARAPAPPPAAAPAPPAPAPAPAPAPEDPDRGLRNLHEGLKELNGMLLPKTPPQIGVPLKAAEIATDPRVNEPLGKAIEEGATPGYPGSFPIG